MAGMGGWVNVEECWQGNEAVGHTVTNGSCWSGGVTGTPLQHPLVEDPGHVKQDDQADNGHRDWTQDIGNGKIEHLGIGPVNSGAWLHLVLLGAGPEAQQLDCQSCPESQYNDHSQATKDQLQLSLHCPGLGGRTHAQTTDLPGLVM